jgi:ABC-type oligopeptide transport system substrate-binding subunit
MLLPMKLSITVIAVLMSLGCAVAAHAEVTNISTQQKTKVVGNNVTTIDSKATVVKNGNTSTKPRSSISGSKPRTR